MRWAEATPPRRLIANHVGTRRGKALPGQAPRFPAAVGDDTQAAKLADRSKRPAVAVEPVAYKE